MRYWTICIAAALLIVLAPGIIHSPSAAQPLVEPTPTPWVNPLQLSKTAQQEHYTHPGQWLTFSFDVSNVGDVPLDGPFWIVDTRIPVINCPQLGSVLMPGEVVTCYAAYQVMELDMERYGIWNTAYVEGWITQSNWAWAFVRNGTWEQRVWLPMLGR